MCALIALCLRFHVSLTWRARSGDPAGANDMKVLAPYEALPQLNVKKVSILSDGHQAG